MEVKQFGDCCGAKIVEDFGGTSCTVGEEDSLSTNEIEEMLTRSVGTYGHLAFICAVLNQEQVTKYHDAFIKGGFKLVAQGMNNNHVNVLNMYIRSNTSPNFSLDEYYDDNAQITLDITQ